MPLMYEITFLPEGRTVEWWGSKGIEYALPDGTRIDVDTVPVWCRTCERISEGERIETLEELDGYMRDVEDPKSPHYVRGRSARRHFLKMLTDRRRWRAVRFSPPKCITCGSADILLLPHNESVPHPAATGTICSKCTGLCRVSKTKLLLTAEGEQVNAV